MQGAYDCPSPGWEGHQREHSKQSLEHWVTGVRSSMFWGVEERGMKCPQTFLMFLPSQPQEQTMDGLRS